MVKLQLNEVLVAEPLGIQLEEHQLEAILNK